VPPNEAAQVAEELRRTQQKLARYNEAYEQQRKREGKTPTE
jgi:predicted alpha/beta-hydrolase family hydrolase